MISLKTQCKWINATMTKNRGCCGIDDVYSTYSSPYRLSKANSSQLNQSLCSLSSIGSTKIIVLAMVNNCLFSRMKWRRFPDLEIAIWSYAHRQMLNWMEHYVDFPSVIAVFLRIVVIANIAWSYSQRWFYTFRRFKSELQLCTWQRNVANNAFRYTFCSKWHRSRRSSEETEPKRS